MFTFFGIFINRLNQMWQGAWEKSPPVPEYDSLPLLAEFPMTIIMFGTHS